MTQWYRICLQCKICGFNPWVMKILWRRKWQPTPVFLPGKSHEQRDEIQLWNPMATAHGIAKVLTWLSTWTTATTTSPQCMVTCLFMHRYLFFPLSNFTLSHSIGATCDSFLHRLLVKFLSQCLLLWKSKLGQLMSEAILWSRTSGWDSENKDNSRDLEGHEDLMAVLSVAVTSPSTL